MKKLFLCLFALLFSLSLFAQTAESEQSSEEESFYYINVPVLRVFDHKDAYVVHYQKGSMGVGEVFVPKEWFVTSEKNKSRVRPLAKGLEPYMTVVYLNGSFLKVFLNMPTDRRNTYWSILSKDIDISSKLNKDTLNIEY